MSSFEDKSILITGGTGSFGHAFLKYLANESFREVRIFSRDELKQDEMRRGLDNPKIKFYIGDVRDRSSVDGAMRNVDYVFHAAALKQVPSCEFFPMEAVQTNVLGSQNVLASALQAGVSKVVCLSTDKAVYPINTMGMTKALMEKAARAFSRNLGEDDTLIASVRYGNVMLSRGSVIPLFINQIKADREITLTLPEMTRFMLPLSAAIDLVVFAFQNGRQGDIFIRKAPSCTIGDLVQALKNIFDSKVSVKVIGMRHGEKIHETLATREELRQAEDMGDYYRVKMDARDLNYNKYFVEGDPEEAATEDYTSGNTVQLSVEEIETLLLTLPEVQAALKD